MEFNSQKMIVRAKSVIKNASSSIISAKETIKTSQITIEHAKQLIELYYLLDCLLNNQIVIVTEDESNLLLDIAKTYNIKLYTRQISIMVNLIHNSSCKSDKKIDLTFTNWSIDSFGDEYHDVNSLEKFDLIPTVRSTNAHNPPLNSFEWEINYETGVDCDGSDWSYTRPLTLTASGFCEFIEIRKMY